MGKTQEVNTIKIVSCCNIVLLFLLILTEKFSGYETSIFKDFSLRHNHPVVHHFIDHWLVPGDHVPFCQHHFVEPDTRIGHVSAPQYPFKKNGRETQTGINYYYIINIGNYLRSHLVIDRFPH